MLDQSPTPGDGAMSDATRDQSPERDGKQKYIIMSRPNQKAGTRPGTAQDKPPKEARHYRVPEVSFKQSPKDTADLIHPVPSPLD